MICRRGRRGGVLGSARRAGGAVRGSSTACGGSVSRGGLGSRARFRRRGRCGSVGRMLPARRGYASERQQVPRVVVGARASASLARAVMHLAPFRGIRVSVSSARLVRSALMGESARPVYCAGLASSAKNQQRVNAACLISGARLDSAALRRRARAQPVSFRQLNASRTSSARSHASQPQIAARRAYHALTGSACRRRWGGRAPPHSTEVRFARRACRWLARRGRGAPTAPGASSATSAISHSRSA